MSLELKGEWIDSGLDALEKEAGKRFATSPDALASASKGVAELRKVRDPLARLGQAPVRGALELVGFGDGVTDGEVRALFQRHRIKSFDERRLTEARTHAEAVAAKDRHDQDVKEVLDAMEKIGKLALKVLIPMLLAAL